jgi:hypothetical protein
MKEIFGINRNELLEFGTDSNRWSRLATLRRALNKFSPLLSFGDKRIAGLAAGILVPLVVACGSGEIKASEQDIGDVSVTPMSSPTVARDLEQPTAIPTSILVPNRMDCNIIRGTEYQSGVEADWYRDNCRVPEVPPGCSEWPIALGRMLTRIGVPGGLCLRLFSNIDEFKAALPGNPIGVGGYSAPIRTISGLTIQAQDSLPIPIDRPLSDLLGLAHEICHAHQHWQMLVNGLGEPRDSSRAALLPWFQTPEGKAFMNAVYSTPGYVSTGPVDPIEDFANICAAWYTRDLGPVESKAALGWVDRWPAIRSFAEEYLPK